LREGGGGRNLHWSQESGLSGGRAKGKKILTCIAIEILEPKGFGRCRMVPVADASSESLHSFVVDNVEPGATVITDAWQGYRWLEKNAVASGPHQREARTLENFCQACIE
jgi:ISXO2-like transposase domain